MEGSSDSVVLERLRTFFEKSAGADGKGGRGRDGGASCLSVGLCLYQLEKALTFLLGNHSTWVCFRRSQTCANIY